MSTEQEQIAAGIEAGIHLAEKLKIAKTENARVLRAWEEGLELVNVLKDRIAALKAERDAYRAGLGAAANSLFTISMNAGKDELLGELSQVRGYANSRGVVARDVLDKFKEAQK